MWGWIGDYKNPIGQVNRRLLVKKKKKKVNRCLEI